MGCALFVVLDCFTSSIVLARVATRLSAAQRRWWTLATVEARPRDGRMNAGADHYCSDLDQLCNFESAAIGAAARLAGMNRRIAQPPIVGRVGSAAGPNSSNAALTVRALFDLMCIKGRFWNNR